MIIVAPLTKLYKQTLITLEVKEQTEKSYDKALTFHSNLGQALFAISENLKHDKETRSLDELLNQYKTIELNLKQFINEQVSSVI